MEKYIFDESNGLGLESDLYYIINGKKISGKTLMNYGYYYNHSQGDNFVIEINATF